MFMEYDSFPQYLGGENTDTRESKSHAKRACRLELFSLRMHIELLMPQETNSTRELELNQYEYLFEAYLENKNKF